MREEVPVRQTMLDHQVAVQLLHAALTQVAEDAGIRVLFFKGHTARVQGLRDAARRPADVDVVVEPDRFLEFVELLHARGWRARYIPRALPRILGEHSATLIHPDWPSDLDLHYFLPGFFDPPADVFDSLWAHRCREVIGGAEVCVPSPGDHVCMLAVNALREPQSERTREELAHLAERLREDAALREAWVQARRRLRVGTVVRPLSRAVGDPDDAEDLAAEDRRLWDLYRASESAEIVGALRYWGRLWQPSAVATRASVLRRIFWKPVAELKRTEVVPDDWSWRTILSLQARRWLRGLRGVRELSHHGRPSAVVHRERPDLALPDLSDACMVAPEEYRRMVRAQGPGTARRPPRAPVSAAPVSATVPEEPTPVAAAAGSRILVQESVLRLRAVGALGDDHGQVHVLPPLDDPSVMPSPVRIAGAGAAVWGILEDMGGQGTADQVIEEARRRFGLDADRAAADVARVVEDLRAVGVLDVS